MTNYPSAVSVVVTVFNEEKNIYKLLHSLNNQSVKPSEIIIVDGRSSDKTLRIINKFIHKYSALNIKVIVEEGNISHGRNKGISSSTGKYIAMIDAGCVAHENWLELLVSRFNTEKYLVVAGFYLMTGDTLMQKALAPFLGVTIKDYNSTNFLPSARSIAFTRKVWVRTVGFDENLSNAGEDTLFNFHLVTNSIKLIREPRALVDWEVPSDLKAAFRKFFYYAKGDAETGIWWHPTKKFKTHNIKILTIYLRYVIFLLLSINFPVDLFLLLTVYSFWSIIKIFPKVEDKHCLIYVPFIQIGCDFSVMLGFLYGYLNNMKKYLYN